MPVTGPQVLQAYERMLESRDKKAEKSADMMMTLALTKQKQEFDVEMFKMGEEATIKRDRAKLDSDILINTLNKLDNEIDLTKKAINTTELKFSDIAGDASLLTDEYKTYEGSEIIKNTGENQLNVLNSQVLEKQRQKNFYDNRLDKGLKSLMRLSSDAKKFTDYKDKWQGESGYLDPHEWEEFFDWAMTEASGLNLAFEGAGFKDAYRKYHNTKDIPKSSRMVLRSDQEVVNNQADVGMANMLTLITPGADEAKNYISSDGKIKLDKWKEKFGDDITTNDVAAIVKALQVVGTGKESNWKAFMQYINAAPPSVRRALEASKYNNVMKLLDDSYAKYNVLERELQGTGTTKSGQRKTYEEVISSLNRDDEEEAFRLFDSITRNDYLNNHDTKELFGQLEKHYGKDLWDKYALYRGFDTKGATGTTEETSPRLKGVVGTNKDVHNEGLLVQKVKGEGDDEWHEGKVRLDEKGAPVMLSGEDLYKILKEYDIKSLGEISKFHEVTDTVDSWDRRFSTGGDKGGYNQGVNIAKDYNPISGFLGLGSKLEGESPYYEAFYESMEESYSKHSKAGKGAGKYFSWLPRFGIEGSIPQDIFDTYGEDAYNLAMELADDAGEKAQIEKFNKVLGDPNSLAYHEVIRILDYMKNNEEMEPVNDEDILEKGGLSTYKEQQLFAGTHEGGALDISPYLPGGEHFEKHGRMGGDTAKNILGGERTFGEALESGVSNALLDVAELAGGAYGLAEAGYEEVSEQLDEYPELKTALNRPLGEALSRLQENLDFGTESRPEFKSYTPENWLTKTLVSLDIIDRPHEWGPTPEGSEIMDDASTALRRIHEHGIPRYEDMSEADKEYYMDELHDKVSKKPNKDKIKFLRNASTSIPQFKEFLIMQVKADPSLGRYLKKNGIDPDKLDKFTEFRLSVKLKSLGINLSESSFRRGTGGRKKRMKKRKEWEDKGWVEDRG